MWTHITSIYRAAGFGWQGLSKAVRTQRPLRQELAIFIPASVLAAFISDSYGTFALLTLPFVVVVCIELINSAIEATVDRISTEQHPLSGDAKDFAAGAVLVANTVTFIIWAIYLFEYIQA